MGGVGLQVFVRANKRERQRKRDFDESRRAEKKKKIRIESYNIYDYYSNYVNLRNLNLRCANILRLNVKNRALFLF